MTKPKSPRASRGSTKDSGNAKPAELPLGARSAAASPPAAKDSRIGPLGSEHPAVAPGVKYRRILLKLSGEALMGDSGYGIDPATLSQIADELIDIHSLGVEVAHRHRRRQHLPRAGRQLARDGPRQRRLHGHAGDGDQLAGAAGRAGDRAG